MESHDEDPDPEDEEMEPDVLSPAEMPILDPRVDADYMDDEILFVIHGVNRNADDYFKGWLKKAQKHNFFLLCPEFSEEYFPTTDSFQLGNVYTCKGGEKNPKHMWSYMVIEHIFQYLRNAGVQRERFQMFGHSAGAQFVHRLAIFLRESHLDKGISANAGWYTMPDVTEKFPYGLLGTNIRQRRIKEFMSRRLVVLIGQDDVGEKNLRQSKSARRQGRTRFDRGISFFLTARKVARNLGVPFRWSLKTVPQTGHTFAGMIPWAMKEFGFVARKKKHLPITSGMTETPLPIIGLETSPSMDSLASQIGGNK